MQIGHDEPMSIVDDWGPGLGENKEPLKLDKLPIPRLSSLAFLFGGVGDGNVYPCHSLSSTDIME